MSSDLNPTSPSLKTAQRVKPRYMGLFAIFCILLQASGALWFSAAALALWLLALAYVDPPALRRIWMPRFWLFTLALALASGLLLGQRDIHILGMGFSRSGLEAGLAMILRGAFVFGLATWASRALSSEGIQRVAAKVGMPWLGLAITGAFQLLPQLRERLGESKRKLPVEYGWRKYHPAKLYSLALALFVDTARLANAMAEESTRQK